MGRGRGKNNLKSNCVMPHGSKGVQRDAFSFYTLFSTVFSPTQSHSFPTGPRLLFYSFIYLFCHIIWMHCWRRDMKGERYKKTSPNPLKCEQKHVAVTFEDVHLGMLAGYVWHLPSHLCPLGRKCHSEASKELGAALKLVIQCPLFFFFTFCPNLISWLKIINEVRLAFKTGWHKHIRSPLWKRI